MKFLFLLLFPLMALGQTKARFFPRLIGGEVEEETLYEDGIERSLEMKDSTYRYVVNFKTLSPMRSAVAIPIHTLSEWSWCSRIGMFALRTSGQYEPLYYETYFKCVEYPSSIDPVRLKETLKKQYCVDGILSKAQEKICKANGLR